MICAFDYFDEVILISHNPLRAVVTQKGNLEHVPRKADGHYAPEHITPIIEAGNAEVYEENDLLRLWYLIGVVNFGCRHF
jgi:hypothetical protein